MDNKAKKVPVKTAEETKCYKVGEEGRREGAEEGSWNFCKKIKGK